MSYSSKYFPVTAEICELLIRIILAKVDWILNKTYDELSNKGKALIRKDTCMKYYNESEPLYLENRCI